MKYSAYPKYKKSSAEWLGDVPSHWEVKRIGHTTYVKGRIGWQGLTSDEFVDEGPYCVTGTDFYDGKINWNSCYHVGEERYLEDPYIQLKDNDLLITKDGTIGKTAIVKKLDGKATLNSGIFLTRPLRHTYNTDYMYWVLNSSSFTAFIDLTKTGTTISHLYQNVFVRFQFPNPPLPEQQSITNFLDRETRRMDALIGKKQKLIELLKEKRTAMISRAVTKGLNPEVKMKPSGVEWLGDVPEHWEIKKIKYLTKVISKGTTPSTEGFEILEDGEIRFIKAENIVENSLSFIPEFFIDHKTNTALCRSILEENDILIVIAGATIGKVAVLEKGFLPTNTNQAVCFIRLREKQLSKLVWYYMQSDLIKNLVAINSVQSAQPNISMGLLKELVFPMPPLPEYQAVAAFLDQETGKIDSLMTKVETAIEKLKEYRTTLISAAVTGKIDVREVA